MSLLGRVFFLRKSVDLRETLCSIGASEDCGVSSHSLSFTDLDEFFLLMKDLLFVDAKSGRAVSSAPRSSILTSACSLPGDGERDGVDGVEPIHDRRLSLREKLLVTEARGVWLLGVVAAVDRVFDDSTLVLQFRRDDATLLPPSSGASLAC